MGRGNAAAQTAANQANTTSTTDATNAAALYGAVVPQLESQAANPSGYSPTDMAAMRTQAEQGAGGTQASAVGAGALRAARTRNSGAAAKAISDSSRGAGEQLSKENLGIETGNQEMKNSNRRAALSSLTGLTGTETGASNQALGEVAPNVNANTNQEAEALDPIKMLMGPASAAIGLLPGYK